ncbi:MAG: amidohydrolase family protein [Ruminococcus sp.]|jgi:imidazolonepropionase-like amidohydrolase|nr:amidohydrolase family protein [Ruminococcus sp.]
MIIYNAVIDGVLSVIEFNEKIEKIYPGELMNITPEDFDAKGNVLIPGFIDAHNHLGIVGNALDTEDDDCNETAEPFAPHLRAIDGINTFDKCFGEALSYGITTAVISPGSANPCGGEIVAVKTGEKDPGKAVIKTVGIKFALGENPKFARGSDESPVTRMGTAAIIREGLYKAVRYKEDLDEWKNGNSDETENENDRPEFDLKSESLIPLLERKIKAFFHCHRAYDIFTAIRIAEEFNLDLVIIHGTEAHLVKDTLAEKKIPVILGPAIGARTKPELSELSEQSGAFLEQAGVNFAICTDHPEIPVHHLGTSVMTLVRCGMSEAAGLLSITRSAAEICSLSSLGRLEVGCDADFLLFDKEEDVFLKKPNDVFLGGRCVTL